MDDTNKELFIETKIDVNSMYEFMLVHAYKSIMGFVGVFISTMAVVGLCIYWNEFNITYKIMFMIIALLFTVINPLTLYMKSKKQVKANDSFNHPLCYTFTGDGIDITQGEQSMHINWDEVIKVTSSKNIVVVYLSPIRAFIFPKEQIGDNFDKFKHIIADNVQCRKVTIK